MKVSSFATMLYKKTGSLLQSLVLSRRVQGSNYSHRVRMDVVRDGS